MSKQKIEKTLIIIKPDAIQRNLLGEIVHRFERKGLTIIGMKMMRLSDAILDEHYSHHKDKPFFESLKNYLKLSPVVLIALSGHNAISATRIIVGSRKGFEAQAGTIRGDFSISGQTNIVHASDDVKSSEEEIGRFFKKDELFEYERSDIRYLYGDDE